ncbi:MAG: (2Fe-2S)-binding protein [Aquincola tertiaricarbonis]
MKTHALPDFPPVATEAVRLDVNGRVHTLQLEPRTHLADALREHCGLTATHLGCEHGVCGACTVEVDGAPQRACLQSALRFAGRQVRTLEAFDDDGVMAELRAAFTAEHALQCGYCTPGMLITARDVVLRLPQADEARIREELAGNLCRCTGYQGIVQAIGRVLAARAAASRVKAAHAA